MGRSIILWKPPTLPNIWLPDFKVTSNTSSRYRSWFMVFLSRITNEVTRLKHAPIHTISLAENLRFFTRSPCLFASGRLGAQILSFWLLYTPSILKTLSSEKSHFLISSFLKLFCTHLANLFRLIFCSSVRAG